jgi:phage virion morphogenesis protein
MMEIHFDNREALNGLNELLRRTGDLRPAMAEIGETLTESTKQRFGSQAGPDGQPWPANSPVTIERKGRDQPLTGETGSLMDEIHYNLVGNDALEVGSPMEYAAMQQFGGDQAEFSHLWGDIPARPFLGFSDEDQDEILAIIQAHLENAI